MIYCWMPRQMNKAHHAEKEKRRRRAPHMHRAQILIFQYYLFCHRWCGCERALALALSRSSARSQISFVLFIYIYFRPQLHLFVIRVSIGRCERLARNMNVSPLLSCCCASSSSPQPPTVNAQPFIFSCAEATLWRGSAKPTQSETMINFGMIHKIFIICVQQRQQQQRTHCAELQMNCIACSLRRRSLVIYFIFGVVLNLVFMKWFL